VTTTFYHKKSSWLQPEKPKQDIGMDLDNLLKQLFDGLGPIIGYRKDRTGKIKHGGVRDYSIVEVHAKK
jgi:Holliday junction resolvase RusA-like endonuclease